MPIGYTTRSTDHLQSLCSINLHHMHHQRHVYQVSVGTHPWLRASSQQIPAYVGNQFRGVVDLRSTAVTPHHSDTFTYGKMLYAHNSWGFGWSHCPLEHASVRAAILWPAVPNSCRTPRCVCFEFSDSFLSSNPSYAVKHMSPPLKVLSVPKHVQQYE
jgi:hypothetical protein